MEKRYKTKDLCEMFNVTRETISNWVQEGKVKACKTAGGHLRFEKNRINDFAAECKLKIKKHGPRRFRVLIVDDQESLLKVLRNMFEVKTKCIDVETAVNGVDAGIKIADLLPDLIILDAMMPGMKGLDVLKTMKSIDKFRKIKVIAYTAYPEEAEKMLKAGADRALVKMGKANEFEILFNSAKELLGKIR